MIVQKEEEKITFTTKQYLCLSLWCFLEVSNKSKIISELLVVEHKKIFVIFIYQVL